MEISNRQQQPDGARPWTNLELDRFCMWLATKPSAGPDWLEIVVTLVAEGMRIGEVVALCSNDIDPDTMTIRVKRTSTRNGTNSLAKTEPRTVALGQRCALIMAPYLSVADDVDSLDTVLAGAAGPYGAMTHQFIFRNTVKAYNQQHDDQLPLISLHQLRHTAGR